MDWRHALALAAVLFLVFVVVKMRPVVRRPGALSQAVRAAQERVREAKTPAERARALCEAGRRAAELGRWTASAGFFMRAMRQDPADVSVVEATCEALAERRPRLCETILWRALARIPWDERHRAAASAAAKGLSSLAARRRRGRYRAEVLRRLHDELSEPRVQ